MRLVKKIIKQIWIWKIKYISPRNFFILLALIVGICSGLAAVFLKTSIHLFSNFILNTVSPDKTNFLFLLLPLIGIILTVIFLKYMVKDNISHGVTKVLKAISVYGGSIKPSRMYSSVIASTLTIGFGGSVGPEAPVVLTGSAIGSNIGKLFKVGYKNMVLLIACGATGAVAGIFNAPIAGLVFALEVLMIDLTLSSLIPILVSAVSAASISYLLMGNEALFSLSLNAFFSLKNLPYYLILGVAAGFISHYFLKITEGMETLFSKINGTWTKVFIGGTIASVLIFFLPPLYGEGFSFLSDIFNGNPTTLLNNTFMYPFKDNQYLFLGFVLLLVFLKVVAMALTNGSGGIGGVFAPSMFVGGILGFFVAHSLNFFFEMNLPEANFALAGMAGVMAGVMHAPLTAIFLIAEITGGYQFILPLMAVSALSFLVNNYFHPHSIYTRKLAEKGELLTHNKDSNALSMMDPSKLIETNFVCVQAEENLGDLVKAIASSKRNVFPVVTSDNIYLGVVFLNDIRTLIFRPELYDQIKVSEIMFVPEFFVTLGENMDEIAQKFLQTKEYNMVVLDNEKHYVGYLSRANVFSHYRKKIKEMSND